MKTLKVKHFYSTNIQINEAYRNLQGKIVFYGNGMRIIGITSYIREKEKSIVSLSVAITMAKANKKILLLDGDLKQKELSRTISQEVGKAGLSDYLSGANQTEDVIYQTDIQNLDILFPGTGIYSAANYTRDKQFDSLMEKLIESYDYVIVDTPSLSRDLDGIIMAQICDGMVLVLRENSIKDIQGRSYLSKLEEVGTPVIGTVLLSEKIWAHNICFAASSGGHYEQLLMLKPLMDQHKSFLVTEKTAFRVADNEDRKIYYLKQINRKRLLFSLRLLGNLWRSVMIYWKERPDVVITTGVLSTIPICLLVKLFRGKLIFIESFAKVNSPTMTGKYLYKHADLFFVQWEELLSYYPNAIYKGGIY